MMNQASSDEDSYQNGPELRSIRMGSAASGSEPSITFPSSITVESKSASLQQQQQEPNMANHKPLHTQEWNVPQDLPPIPSDYALGYSHAIVHDASPQTVANRIVKAIAQHSIATVPDDSHENSLLTEATCGLKLAINLYAASNDEEQSGSKGGVLVEVERRIGCAYGFRLCSTAILKAAKGVEGGAIKLPSFQLPQCIPRDAQEERKKCIQFDTQQALELVKSERTDAQLLGLEFLERLSRDEYAASLLHTNESIVSIQSFLAHDATTCVMKRRALGVLANIMRLDPSKQNESCDGLQCQYFLKALVDTLQNTSSPHEACAATKCLQSSLDALSQDKHEDLAEILRNFSVNHHSQLAQESKVLQDRLRNNNMQ